MHLTSATDYAFRVLIYLASNPDRLIPTREIGAAFDISTHHLGKIVHRLGRGGWVEVKRGRGGGLQLGRPPREIRLDELVRAFEPEIRFVECFDPTTNECPIAEVCGFSSILGQARDAFFETLRRHTLEDALNHSGAEAYRERYLSVDTRRPAKP